jgi:hypothetical protein
MDILVRQSTPSEVTTAPSSATYSYQLSYLPISHHGNVRNADGVNYNGVDNINDSLCNVDGPDTRDDRGLHE